MEDLIKEPIISVGILRASEISVDFSESFVCKDLGLKYSGHKEVTLKNGVPTIDGLDVTGLVFEPANGHSDFSIDNVQIGIGFHWDRRMRQTFGGSVKFVVDGDKIWTVNLIGVESYLKCVISSEMKSTSDLELLKAHAVTSRSWLMAQVWGKSKFHGQQKREEDGEIVTWRDREDHDLFDVCADDHCQRYQGVTMASNANVNKAIDATRGQLLVYDGEVCDARFSKCCGGVTEIFSSCWSDDEHPYLQSFYDALRPPSNMPSRNMSEAEARSWIMSYPDAFCNTSDDIVLSQVLNDYDFTTKDFFRWKIVASGEELGSLIHTKGGFDVGVVTDLIPLRRGPSGRIVRLKIVGDKKSIIVGKELEIRRLLSPTHLYSSAFVVSRSGDGRNFTINGAGWGHGVGLCQIGAAVMANRGFSYRSILYHYFRRALIEKHWS